LAIFAYIIQKNREINEPLDEDQYPNLIYDEEGKMIGSIAIYFKGPGYEHGMVILTNNIDDLDDDMTYEYKYYQGKFWVLVDGEWVQQPAGWKPGDEPVLP
jgi:hypothetical protein